MITKRFTLLLLTCFAWVLPSHAEGVVVVANRYLLPNRTSHAHLYLYREDGRLLRQLTHDNVGQDRDPIFSSDGKTIVWTRVLPSGAKQYWSTTPRGTKTWRLKAAPEWYRDARTSDYFADTQTFGEFLIDNGKPQVKVPRLRTPDGAQEIELRIGKDEGDEWDGYGHGGDYLLRDVRNGKQIKFRNLPGFYGVFDVLGRHSDEKQHFLWEKNLHVVFFDLHLDSTNGDTVFALDLIRKRLVRLSPNWAAPIPLSGESNFLTLTFNRYVPIPASKKTANCRFFERWDSNFKKVRYARTNCVISYGASMLRAGKSPRVVTVRDEES